MTTFTIDEKQSTVDLTVRLLDEYYDETVPINSNEFELVNSYFMSINENPRIARNFTSFLFKIAANTGTPVLQLLDEIRGA